MIVPLPSTTKKSIRRRVRAARLAYVRWRHSFGAEELESFLRQLGLQAGHIVLVHSAFDELSAFRGKPTDVVRVLQSVIQESGILAMPTLPFTGTAVAYVKQERTFDVRRTPSAMGLITEVFRRLPGVSRSVHPTHSVAAWGLRAREFLADHDRATTPCGVPSPYARLLDWDGWILFVGVDIESMTFFHFLEEKLERDMPFSPFTGEVYHLTSRRLDGSVAQTVTRLFDPAVSRRRNLGKLIPLLRHRNAWRHSHLGGTSFLLIRAADVWDAVGELASKGLYCYD